MKRNRYKVDLEIFIVFLGVIGISVFNAIYSTDNIAKNQKAVNQIMATEIPSLQKLEEMRLIINQTVMYTTRWVYLPDNPEDKEKLESIQTIDYPNLKTTLLQLAEKWNDIEETKHLDKTINGFESLIHEEQVIMKLLSHFEEFENPEKHFKAEEILENNIVPHSKILISELNKVVIQKQSQVDVLHEKISSSSRLMLLNLQAISILIIIVIVIASFYISKRMILPIMRLKNNILQMGSGEIPKILSNKNKNAVGLMTEAVRSLAESLRKTTQFAHKIGGGNLSAEFQPLSENDELGNALLQMRNSLRIADNENKKRMAFSHFTEKINRALRENVENIQSLSDQVISIMVKALNGFQGGMYLIEEEEEGKPSNIKLFGCYALEKVKKGNEIIEKESGLVGQVIKDGEHIYLRNLSNHKKLIYSGMSSFSPSHVLIIPLKHQNNIYGAVEISGFSEFKDFEIEFIKGIGETIGTTIANVKANTLTRQLLVATREQATKLGFQEEELRRTNSELSIQSKLLQASEEELKQSNLELKLKARELQQKNEINEQAREALSLKAKELETSNKYKSEFLANMSHELRTPLNSLLILARLLHENKESNLTPKQKEYANVIHKSGKNLLVLINDILDLSKIEAGKMQINPESTDIQMVKLDMKMLFEELALEKQIHFETIVDPKLPETFTTDKVRLEQVIKNLLSNAFKFTPSGGKIIFEIKKLDYPVTFTNSILKKTRRIVEFSVKDTGIGIPKDKQEVIFEAFQQADGSINRSYGGTGLGLSISKMLLSILGGEMRLESEKDKGSTFYFYLPYEFQLYNDPEDDTRVTQKDRVQTNTKLLEGTPTDDDRNSIQAGDKILLIVEDDVNFAHELLEKAHDRNFKAIIASDGDQGINFAKKFHPSAIIMDIQLPEVNGWSVLNEIKSDKSLSHIPVHVMSAYDKKKVGLDMGAFAFIKKPLDKHDLDEAFVTIDKSIEKYMSKILVVEDMDLDREIIKQLLKSRFDEIEIITTKNKEEAVDAMSQHSFDLIILDLNLGNGPEEGVEFLEELRSDDKKSKIPVVIFTGQEINADLQAKIAQSSAKIFSKNDPSFDKLIEESEIFLRNLSNNELSSPNLPTYMEDILKRKKILLIDDDMRNIYSISKALTNQQMIVEIVTENDELRKFMNTPKSLDIIIVDLSFKNIDVYQTIKDIKKDYADTPIIALTPKASISDREKAIQHGASDYISKPVDINQLYSLIRVWLYKE